MGTLRYALIGSGMMGQEHIRNVELLGDATVVAVGDPDAAMRTAAAEFAGAEPFADWREMIARVDCDAYILASPNHLHAEALTELIPLGRPILAEKPLATTVADCERLVRLAGDHGTPVWVAMEYRYMPPVARLIREVEAGTAGRLRMIAIREHRFPFLDKVGNWNRFAAHTGGTMVEKCCHFFDLMRLIAQAEPARLYCSGAMDVNHHDEIIDGRRPDIIDNAFTAVDFDNGVRAMLDLCMFAEGAEFQEVITATGSAARVEAMIPGPARFAPNGREQTAWIAIADRATRHERREPIEVDEALLAAGDHHGSTFFQHQRFAALVRHGGRPEVTIEDGAKAVAIGAAAEESARTGKAVTL